MEKNNDNLVIHEGVKVSDRKRLLIFININISCIVANMLQTSVTTALPPIMKDFNIDATTGQWITSGFSLFLAIVVPLTAYLITRFRTKRLYCTAMAVFILGLTICALSPNFWVMMVGRIIQGCGSGLISSISQVIILTIYPPEKKGTAMGWYGMSIAVAPVVAPTLTGVIVDYMGWRMIFYIFMAVMFVSLIIGLVVFDDVLPVMKKNFDVVSLIISTFAFGGVTLAAGNIGKYKFFSVEVLLVLLVGILFSVIFVMRQLRLKVPFLDVLVFRDRKVAISIIATSLLQLLIIGSAVIFPIYVQHIKNKSATISGLVILPGSIVMAILCPLAGKIYDRFGITLLFFGSAMILMISNLSLYFVNIQTSVWVISAIHVVRCLGFGILLMPIITWGMSDVSPTKASDATAFFNSFRFIGSALGSALFVSIMAIVANNVKGKKDYSEMYGFNVVFLSMTILSFVLLLLGLLGYKKGGKKEKTEEIKIKESSNNNKNKNNNNNDNNDILPTTNSTTTTNINKNTFDDVNEIDIVVKNEQDY